MTILLGLFLSGLGLFMLWRSVHLRLKGLFTIGTVIKKVVLWPWGRGAPVLTVSFKTIRNKTITFTSGGLTGINRFSFYQVGGPVPVLYDPNNPRNAVIYTLYFIYLSPLFFVGLGFFLIYQGFAH
jgi:hypothetical protein